MDNPVTWGQVFWIFIGLGVFSFLRGFLTEWWKDRRDISGTYNSDERVFKVSTVGERPTSQGTTQRED